MNNTTKHLADLLEVDREKFDTSHADKRKTRNRALVLKEKHDNYMKGKKTRLVPHPLLPRTFIEKIIG